MSWAYALYRFIYIYIGSSCIVAGRLSVTMKFPFSNKFEFRCEKKRAKSKCSRQERRRTGCMEFALIPHDAHHRTVVLNVHLSTWSARTSISSIWMVRSDSHGIHNWIAALFYTLSLSQSTCCTLSRSSIHPSIHQRWCDTSNDKRASHATAHTENVNESEWNGK